MLFKLEVKGILVGPRPIVAGELVLADDCWTRSHHGSSLANLQPFDSSEVNVPHQLDQPPMRFWKRSLHYRYHLTLLSRLDGAQKNTLRKGPGERLFSGCLKFPPAAGGLQSIGSPGHAFVG